MPQPRFKDCALKQQQQLLFVSRTELRTAVLLNCDYLHVTEYQVPNTNNHECDNSLPVIESCR